MKKFLALLCILALALPSALAGDTLTILRMDHDFYPMDENRLQQAQGQLQQAFPGMEVVTRQGIPTDAQPFKVDAKGNIKLTNGDIYALISPNLNRLISADALLCLSEEEAMAGLLSALPDYGALWGKEGKVYGLPTRLTILLAKPDRDSDLKALGLSPVGWTWQQVFDALPLVKEMNAKNGTDIKLLKENQALFLPLWLKQFCWQETLFPSPQAKRKEQLTKLLTSYKALAEEGLLAKEGERALITLGYTAFDGYMDAHFVLPPALVSGGKSAMLSAEMMVVPKDAANKQASLAYLQALFSEKAIAQSLSYWQHGVLLKDTQPKINLSTQQSLMLWQDAIAKGYPDMPLPLMQKLLPLWQQYMAGTLALEPCVEQMLLLLPAAE